jgi:hypothetical protein
MKVRGDLVDLGLRVLDHQLVDESGIRCGKIDDIELAPGDDSRFEVSALLSGPRAQRRRLPAWLRRLSGWFGADVEHRVEWSHVANIGAAVELDCVAEDIALGAGDRKVRDIVERLPRS